LTSEKEEHRAEFKAGQDFALRSLEDTQHTHNVRYPATEPIHSVVSVSAVIAACTLLSRLKQIPTNKAGTMQCILVSNQCENV